MIGRATTSALLLAATCVQAAAADPAPAIPMAPALAAVDPATGAPVVLDPSHGPMLLAFLATWCRPCLADVPKLADLEERWKPDGFRMVLVAVATRQTPERLRELIAQEPLPGRLLFDANGAVAGAANVSTLPAYVLVDRHGRMVARSGVLDPAFAQAVERLVRQEGHAP